MFGFGRQTYKLSPDADAKEQQLFTALSSQLKKETDSAGARQLYVAAVALFEYCRAKYPDLLHTALLTAARNGVADAWVDVGRCYWNGWGVKENRSKARESYVEGARQGSIEGACVVAINALHSGELQEAEQYARLSLKLGDRTGRSEHVLASILARRKVPGSDRDIFELASTSASLGDPDGMFMLHQLHWQGLGCKQDFDAARRWCVEAADKGNLRAQYNLGAFFATGGHGFDCDTTLAIQWYSKASDGGHGQAAFNLALIFATGQGVSVDRDTALKYVLRAGDLGLEVDEMLFDTGCRLVSEADESTSNERADAGVWMLSIAAAMGHKGAQQVASRE